MVSDEAIDIFVPRLGGAPLVFLAEDLVLIDPALLAELIRSLSHSDGYDEALSIIEPSQLPRCCTTIALGFGA